MMQKMNDRLKLVKDGAEASTQKKWKFKELLQEANVAERFAKVRKYFYLRESTYDMSNRCNLQCDGCYYYEGEKQFTKENRDPAVWRDLMRAEKERGITFVVLAGAEPALVAELLQACYDELPAGCIATNGFKKIPESVGYRLHISVWGNDETTLATRKVDNLLARQIENYRGDERAIWVYTFTKQNIEEAEAVTKKLAAHGCPITFNIFSSPVGYQGELAHDEASLKKTRAMMLSLLETYPETVIFSPYSAVAHTHRKGLHDLYSCSYPRKNENTDIGLGRSFRQYRTDLSWDRSAACCVPDTDCPDCRHYAAGSAVVTARMTRHADTPEHFKAWLDYVDTYLAVWVKGYRKGENLMADPVSPPGFGLYD